MDKKSSMIQSEALVAIESMLATPGRRSGEPITGRCQQNPDLECWKLATSDPLSRFDFLVMITITRMAGDNAQLALVIPQNDDTLIHAVRGLSYQVVTRTSTVTTLRAEFASGGLVTLSRVRATQLYHGLREMTAEASFYVGRWDLSQEAPVLLEPYRKAGKLPPAIPEGLRAAEASEFGARLAQHMNPGRAVLRHAIRFPRVNALGDGEWEVEDGQEFSVPAGLSLPASLGRSAHRRPPGWYVDFAELDGTGSLTIHSLVDEGGYRKVLFGEACNTTHYSSLVEHVFVKKRKSWLGGKIKVTILRKELTVTGHVCGPLI